MALYAIGDLHLCLGAPKPMDVFGGNWIGYMDKLRAGMEALTEEDTLVLMGDLSWALDLASASADFAWINAIPGRKIILKGNHDYWWSTQAKFTKFCQEHSFEGLNLLNNNCYFYKDLAICGTRGWFFEEERSGQHDEKVFRRDLMRLEASLHQNPEDIIIDREEAGDIEERLFSVLSGMEREVLSLFLRGMTYQEIARYMQKQPKAIDNALQRIKTKLRTILR